jgi:2-hydroxy-6-oxonona-2,4-dienedioate hydrolase
MVPTGARLAEDFRVYALDLPGFGHSSKPPHALGLPALAEVLRGWMSQIGLDRAPMVGNSFGCQVIAEFGVRHPERLERAVLQGPTIDAHARRAIRQFGRFALDLPREKVPEYFINAHDYWRTGLHRGWETFQIALEDRIEDKLPRLGMPVMVVRGQHDPIVSQRWVEELTALLPNGRLVITRGAHTPNFSEPDTFANVVRAFRRPA